RKPGLLRTCPGTPSQRRAGDPLFSGKAWPTENVTLIGRRSPLTTETRQRLRRAESYRHVASYAESRLREGNPNSIRLGFEHAPRFAGFVCPNPALSVCVIPKTAADGRNLHKKPYAT